MNDPVAVRRHARIRLVEWRLDQRAQFAAALEVGNPNIGLTFVLHQRQTGVRVENEAAVSCPVGGNLKAVARQTLFRLLLFKRPYE